MAGRQGGACGAMAIVTLSCEPISGPGGMKSWRRGKVWWANTFPDGSYFPSFVKTNVLALMVIDMCMPPFWILGVNSALCGPSWASVWKSQKVVWIDIKTVSNQHLNEMVCFSRVYRLRAALGIDSISGDYKIIIFNVHQDSIKLSQ